MASMRIKPSAIPECSGRRMKAFDECALQAFTGAMQEKCSHHSNMHAGATQHGEEGFPASQRRG